jgi:hypothetical protein
LSNWVLDFKEHRTSHEKVFNRRPAEPGGAGSRHPASLGWAVQLAASLLLWQLLFHADLLPALQRLQYGVLWLNLLRWLLSNRGLLRLSHAATAAHVQSVLRADCAALLRGFPALVLHLGLL